MMDIFRKFVCCSFVRKKRDERHEILETFESSPTELSSHRIGDTIHSCRNISNHNGDKREETVMEILEVFDTALAKLYSLEELPLLSEDSSWVDDMLGKIHSCKFGLRFLKLFLWSLFILEDIDGEIKKTLFSLDFTRQTNWGIFGKNIVEPFHWENKRLECAIWITDLQSRIQHCKQKLEVWCEFFLQCSLKCDSFENKTTLDFVEGILENLRDIHKFKSDEEIVFLKNQIATLMKKLTLLQKLVFLSPVEWSDFEEMRGFKIAVQAFAQCSAILIFMYWVREIDEEMATKLNLFLFNVLQKIAPCAPAFIAFYNRFLKEMKLVQFESLLLGQIVQIFLDLLLENLVDILKDDFQILEEGLMFVIAFLANPPHHHSDDEEFMVLSAEIDVLVKDDLYLLISVDDMKGEGNFSKINACLSNIMRKVQLMKGKVEQVYDKIRDSFSYDYPKINGLGFFDFLLQNLGLLRQKLKRDMSFIPFAKHLIIKIEEELIYMRPYLNDLFERQKDQKEQKDTWLKVIKLAYQTEYAINSCSVINHPLWYNMARLMEILNEIKVVNSQLEKIGCKKTQGGGFIHCSTLALNKVLEVPRASGFNEVMVGLDKELDIIIENLISGSKYLDIVAIVGMPGLGKTTMANRVYKSAAVRNHFHMFAYCVVSQVHNARKILLQILSDIKGKDDELYGMPEEDLADMLRKCLKGKKYLIILDDIWNVKAWDEIKSSLPNDQNGSRVIFTTRICNIAIQAKEDCILHELRFLSDDESWELLRNKTFREEDCPPAFLEVGKKIAKTCKGLPLTLVLIAGLLARTERSLSCWNKMSEAIGSYVSTEGCMEVLELSYQHLPEHLKPCFLYFGAFAEDKLIHANKLMLLWIAEGFVKHKNCCERVLM